MQPEERLRSHESSDKYTHGVPSPAPPARGRERWPHRSLRGLRSMRIRILLCLLTILGVVVLPARAAPPAPVKWTARLEPSDARAGEAARLVVTATIDAGYHIYSTTKVEGPVPTSIELVPGKVLVAAGSVVQPPAKKTRDEGFGVDVETYA